jgi:glyoxylase-like metal-dependent hydrolase (beta-lactamase superfamily II)
VRAGADTLYPEWRARAATLTPPATQSTIKPVYTDASTHIAERADAQRPRPPSYDKVEALHVAGNVYLIAGAGANIVVSAGGDGVVMVDSGATAPSELRRPCGDSSGAPATETPESASPPSATSWQAAHAFPEPMIRMIINTSGNPDHVGGNGNIRMSPMFRLLGYRDPSLSLQVLAHAAVQSRMTAAKAPERLVPTDTYLSETYTLYRFFNNQAVQIFHMPRAVTDGDSVVWFRRSDAIAAGDVYNSDIYPPIDVDKGGSINGNQRAQQADRDERHRIHGAGRDDDRSGSRMDQRRRRRGVLPRHADGHPRSDPGDGRQGPDARAGEGGQADDGLRPGIRQGTRGDVALRRSRLPQS